MKIASRLVFPILASIPLAVCAEEGAELSRCVYAGGDATDLTQAAAWVGGRVPGEGDGLQLVFR